MEFKNLRKEIFENVKLKGMYEHKPDQVQLIIEASFSVIPNTEVEISPEDFQKKLRKKLSLFAIDRSCKELKLVNWFYEGSRFTYDHDLSSISLQAKQVCSLGIDMNFIQNGKIQSRKLKNHKVTQFYKEICPEIAKLQPFKTEDFITIRPNRKPK
jgi:hypothetical protein